MRTVKKYFMAACVGVMLVAGVTGCTKTTESSRQMQKDTVNESDSPIKLENKDNGKDSLAEPEKAETENLGESDGTQENDPAPATIASREGTEFLSGKVQSVEADDMIIAQTTLLEDGMVTLVDEKDAKKISVKFTADTKVEHWIIKDGGADIDRKDAALSDLTAGMGVEIQGYYEGETFVAVRILIEEYV